MHGGHALEFNGRFAALFGIPWHDAAGACARTSPERRHAVPSKSVKKCENQKSENRVKKVVLSAQAGHGNRKPLEGNENPAAVAMHVGWSRAH